MRVLGFGGAPLMTREKHTSKVGGRYICVSKDLSGMSFHDMEIFNQLMLTMHSRRILKNRRSLLSRLLKGY